MCLSTLLLSSCAALLNSDRPAYDGPIVKPIWTVHDLAFDRLYPIHNGIVYARARTFASDVKRLYAFEAKTGQKLWQSDFAVEDIKFFVGPLLFATDDTGKGHGLNAITGREVTTPSPTDLLLATVQGETVYAVWKDRAITAMDRPAHNLWRAKIPMDYLAAPVVADGNVYISGSYAKVDATPQCEIYALDALTGALRWKWGTGSSGDKISQITAEGGAVYVWVGYSSGVVFALDAATGKPRWTKKTTQYLPEGPVGFDPLSIVIRDAPPRNEDGSLKSKGYLFRGLKRSTGEALWEASTPWKYSTWFASSGLLYIADRKAHALLNEGGDTSPDSWLTIADLRTGRELWRSETIELGSFTEPVVGEGIVVVGSWPYQFQKATAAQLMAFRATRDGK